jgi:hypothetical protein
MCSALVAKHNTRVQFCIKLWATGTCCAHYQQKQHMLCENSCQTDSLRACSYAQVSKCMQRIEPPTAVRSFV